MYRDSTAILSVDQVITSARIENGVRQGNPMSSELFPAILEQAMFTLNWGLTEIQILRKMLTRDDCVLFASRTEELQTFVNKLALVCSEVGIKTNYDKTSIK